MVARWDGGDRTGHKSTYSEIEKMRWLALPTHRWIRTRLTWCSSSFSSSSSSLSPSSPSFHVPPPSPPSSPPPPPPFPSPASSLCIRNSIQAIVCFRYYRVMLCIYLQTSIWCNELLSNTENSFCRCKVRLLQKRTKKFCLWRDLLFLETEYFKYCIMHHFSEAECICLCINTFAHLFVQRSLLFAVFTMSHCLKSAYGIYVTYMF